MPDAFDHAGYAESLLDMAGDDEAGSDIEHFHLAKAQVHATLALVGAIRDQTEAIVQAVQGA
jgi:hypothetical protein